MLLVNSANSKFCLQNTTGECRETISHLPRFLQICKRKSRNGAFSFMLNTNPRLLESMTGFRVGCLQPNGMQDAGPLENHSKDIFGSVLPVTNEEIDFDPPASTSMHTI